MRKSSFLLNSPVCCPASLHTHNLGALKQFCQTLGLRTARGAPPDPLDRGFWGTQGSLSHGTSQRGINSPERKTGSLYFQSGDACRHFEASHAPPVHCPPAQTPGTPDFWDAIGGYSGETWGFWAQLESNCPESTRRSPSSGRSPPDLGSAG